MINNIINCVENAIINAENDNNKLSTKALNIEGMSGKKNRIFLNSVLEIEQAKYLEIGTWKGSTLYSALYKNNPEYAVAIDNWSLFGGPKEQFLSNMSDVGVEFNFFDKDCFNIDKKYFKNKFNIYFYDGEHEFEDQKKAITYYYDCLEDVFLYICDDWIFEKVRLGTYAGLSECNIKIEKQWVLGDMNVYADSKNWWNCLYVAVCSKYHN